MTDSPTPEATPVNPPEAPLHLLPQIATGVVEILDLLEPSEAPGIDKLDLIISGLRSLSEEIKAIKEQLPPLEQELSLTGAVLKKVSERLQTDFLSPMQTVISALNSQADRLAQAEASLIDLEERLSKAGRLRIKALTIVGVLLLVSIGASAWSTWRSASASQSLFAQIVQWLEPIYKEGQAAREKLESLDQQMKQVQQQLSRPLPPPGTSPPTGPSTNRLRP